MLAAHLGDFAEPLGNGVDRLLTILLSRDRAAEDAQQAYAEPGRDRDIGTRERALLIADRGIERAHTHARVDRDDGDAGILEASAGLADPLRRQLVERREIDRSAQETDLDPDEAVGMGNVDHL